MKLKYSAKSHGYWLDGKRCKSPSAVAKVPDDSSALDFWRRRQTAIGLALQPHLLTAVAANAGDKKALDQLCEEAMAAAGANSGRDWGTSVHKLTDAIDGGDFVLETPEVVEIRRRWTELLAAHDLEVVASEQVIVHPELMVAGRFDRVVRHRASGDLLILDTKTGASAHQFLQAHAVQLHLYASAPLRADGPTGDVDFEVHDFVPMWPVRTDVALVAHLPAEGTDAIIGVDIAAGGRCFRDVIQPTWQWRGRNDLRVDAWQRNVALPGSELSPRTANLIERLRAIAAASPAEAAAIRASWPGGVAPLSKGGHSDDDLDRVEWLVDDSESRLSLPFNGLPPEPVARPSVTPRPAAVVIDPDEGPDATDEQVAKLRAVYDELDDAARSWIGQLVTEGTQAGATFHLRTNRSMRALRIVRGLVSLARAGADDAEAVRSMVAKALDDDIALQPSIPLGAALAMLDAIQAAMFAGMAAALANGRLQLTFDDDGVMRVVDTPLSLDEIAGRFGDAAA